MKKRLFILLLLPVLLLSGCGQRRSPRVAVCLRECADSGAVEKLGVLRAALTEAGYEVAALDGEEDQSRQTGQVEELLNEGYDLLVLEPVMNELAPQLADMAQKNNVPVIFIGNQPALEDWEDLCYIGGREEEPGAVQPRVLDALSDGGDLNGDGVVTYAVIAGAEDDVDAATRTQTLTENMAGQCLAVQYTDWSREQAETACGQLLSTYGKDLEVVFCNSDELAMGAAKAIAEGGREVNRTIYLVGLGGDFQARMLLRSGDLTGTVYLPLEDWSGMILQAARQLLDRNPVESLQYGTYIPLTGDNVEDYITE